MGIELELEPVDDACYSASRDTISCSGYMGLEKRIKNRRVTPDRRETIRFETGKSDRRSGIDRRRNSQNWKYQF